MKYADSFAYPKPQCGINNSAKDKIKCMSNDCGTIFPMVDGIPVLINEDSSIFSFNGFVAYKSTTFQIDRSSRLRCLTVKMTPKLTIDTAGHYNINMLTKGYNTDHLKALVISAGIFGEASFRYFDHPVCTDVTFGPIIDYVCDTNGLPFQTDIFEL